MWKNFFNEYRTLWAACWCTSFFRWNSPVFIRRWIYYCNVILYAAVHLKHATNYKLLQILTFSAHELLYSRYIWFSLHVYAFKSHMQGKNTHSCAHCTKCACPHLLNIVTKKYFYVLRRMEIHFIFHKFSGSFFCERVYVCECVAFYHCRHNCRIHTLFFSVSSQFPLLLFQLQLSSIVATAAVTTATNADDIATTFPIAK